MSIQNRLKRLENSLDTSAETVEQLLDRMHLRAEVQMMPELKAAVERANQVARAAGLPERDLPELSDDARQLAERDTADLAAKDGKRFAQLTSQGVIDSDEWRAKNGGVVPAPEPLIEEARKRREQRGTENGADGGSRW